MEALGTPLSSAAADGAGPVVASSAHRRERLACRAYARGQRRGNSAPVPHPCRTRATLVPRVTPAPPSCPRRQLENLRVLRQRQITGMHYLERSADDVERTREDVYAEARAKHEALQRELAEQIADVLLKASVDAEESELLAPIYADLDRSRSRIAELERAEASLEHALQLEGPDEFEREAHQARAHATRVATSTPEHRAAAWGLGARFETPTLLERLRLVSSATDAFGLLPDAVSAVAQLTGEDAAAFRIPLGMAAAQSHVSSDLTWSQQEQKERRPSVERWRRRTDPSPPAFPPIPSIPPRYFPPELGPRAPLSMPLRRPASTLATPLLDVLAHYRTLSHSLPQPAPPRTTSPVARTLF
ncbi:hypothetical protein T492DRAFT_832215 [Pavlovales sp. CCMP2436]|nr:hypothetical protein T492DRAFT_832215 [Pavlovales sp. CCMP2436]